MSLLVDRPTDGLRTLAQELERACRHLDRRPRAPYHAAAARAIVAATEAELRATLAELERLAVVTADPADSSGFRALIVTLIQAQARLASPEPSAEDVDRARALVACVASLLSWAATNLEIRRLPETAEPLV